MEDLLVEEIYLNEDSKKIIHANYRLYKNIAIIFCITSVIGIFVHLLRYFRHANEVYKNWLNVFNFQVYPFIFFIQVILSLFEVYYIFNGLKYQRRSVDESDQSLFNNSFFLFAKAYRLGIIIMCIHFLYELVFFYGEVIR